MEQLSPSTTTTEAVFLRVHRLQLLSHVLQLLKPVPTREATTTSSPHTTMRSPYLLQLEKAHTQQQRHSPTKNNNKNELIKAKRLRAKKCSLNNKISC